MDDALVNAETIDISAPGLQISSYQKRVRASKLSKSLFHDKDDCRSLEAINPIAQTATLQASSHFKLLHWPRERQSKLDYQNCIA